MEQNFESGTNILAECERTQSRRKYVPCLHQIFHYIFKKEQSTDKTNEKLLELLKPTRYKGSLQINVIKFNFWDLANENVKFFHTFHILKAFQQSQ